MRELCENVNIPAAGLGDILKRNIHLKKQKLHNAVYVYSFDNYGWPGVNTIEEIKATLLIALKYCNYIAQFLCK